MCPPRFASIVTATLLIVALFMTVISIDKIVVFGLYSYVSHWTNWSWSALNVFLYSLAGFSLPASVPLCNVRCASSVMAWAFIPLLEMILYISFAVYALLLHSPDFIVDLFDTIEPGIVMVANDIFHTFPVFIILGTGFVLSSTLYAGLRRYGSRYWAQGWACFAAFCTYQTFGGIVLFFFAYNVFLAAIGTTLSERYTTDLSFALAVASLIMVGFVVGGLLMCMAIYYWDIRRPSSTPCYDEQRAQLLDDSTILGDDLDAIELIVRRRCSRTGAKLPSPFSRDAVRYPERF